jgi:GTP-binding protein YchF
MRLGIIGLPNSGKTTVFNALTGSDYPTEPFSSGQLEVHTAVVPVPDERVDRVSVVYQPKKLVYATVTYTDIGGLDKGMGQEGLSGPMRTELQQVDGFLHVLRAFDDAAVPHSLESVDPLRDLTIIDGEFLLLDLIAVENRLARLEEDRKKGKTENKQQNALETALMQRLHAQLEAEQPLRDLDLTPDEIKELRGYGLLTLKPVLVIVNLGDDGGTDPLAGLDYDHRRTMVVSLRGKLEAEIAQLDDPEDVALFLAEYAIDKPSRERLLQVSYELLGVHSFITVGDDEVRAWALRKGGTALEAAATVHTDLARGFIRAEVVAYDDFIAAGSSMTEVKAQGKMRLEGKEYVVRDGDIITIRFNI